MEWYKNYKIVKDENGYILNVYLNPNDVEFSDDFINSFKGNVSKFDDKVKELVKKDFSHLKVKSVKLMAGTLVIATISIVTPTKALAEEINNINPSQVSFVGEAGITEDSFFYSVDKLLDELKVVLSFGSDSKIKTLTDISEERLGEAEDLAKEGNLDGAQEAIDDYNKTSNEAIDLLEKTINEDKESEQGTTNEKLSSLEDRIGKLEDNSIQVLEKIKENSNEEAQGTLDKVIEMQASRKEAVEAMVDARHQLNDAKKEYNEAKEQLKKAEQSGDEEAIKQAEEQLAAVEKNLNTKQDDYKAAFDKKQESVKKYTGNEKIDKEEPAVKDESKAEQTKDALNITSDVKETDDKDVGTANKATITPKKESKDNDKEIKTDFHKKGEGNRDRENNEKD